MTGNFFVIEGIDGAGKTTLINNIREALQWNSLFTDKVVITREPGGTPIGEHLRSLVLGDQYDMGAGCELLLFQAARVEHIDKVIAPALAQGKTVITDRYYFSTIAYQCARNGMAQEHGLPFGDFTENRQAPHIDGLIMVGVDDPGVVLDRMRAEGKDRIEARGKTYLNMVNYSFAHQSYHYKGNKTTIPACYDENQATITALRFIIETVEAKQLASHSAPAN